MHRTGRREEGGSAYEGGSQVDGGAPKGSRRNFTAFGAPQAAGGGRRLA